jgi:hypothetical protein
LTTSINDTGGKFANGVNDTGGKIAAGVVDSGGNLPLVSTTPAANFVTRFTSVVDTGGNLPPVPLVSMTPVANNGINIKLQIP